MDKQSALNLISDTFNHPFNEERFANFSVSLLNNLKLSSNHQWQNTKTLPASIRDYIVEFKEFGILEYENQENLVVGIAKLKSRKIVEKSRSIQREFAKHLMEVNNSDASLISFFADDYEDWRFSFVKLDYGRLLTEKGKIKIKKIISPLKRFSFIVGKNEPNNTAKSQIAPLLYNKKNSINDIEKAFSVEKVTKEFFDQYKRLCFKIRDELILLRKNDKNIDNDFKKHFLNESDFAKKFMGQIIFLYFIQKKGWIGISRNKDGFFKKWGNGPKDFLRKLFNKEFGNYKNFFNDILEDLFYIGLSVDLPDNYYSKLKCKVPFLNGGLFEPINDYNWKETDITIKNSTIKEVLDIFDTFNFTVKEEDPLEKEIAIDPETLGKVFENLLDENLQRGHGVFYTPRNIVNYMCESGLASSFVNNLKLDLNLIDYKKYINEISLLDLDNSNSLNLLSLETLKFLKDNSKEIESFLKNIRICDPAVGSGAFPVSMMNIVVKIRKALKVIDKKVEQNLNYNLKLHFIKKNIYGVDIDKSAVDIAKLRLWLSLTIDQENYDRINTLPNLDYKFLQGNSLFDDLGGNIRIKENEKQYSFDNSFSEKEDLINLYFEKIKEFDLLNNQIEKKIEREKINQILKKIILSEIQIIKSFDKRNPILKQLSKNLEDLDKKINDFFCWNIIFHKIFKKNGGFDLILANPPYLRQEEIINYKDRIKDRYKLFNSTSDLYTYFYELSFNLLKPKGTSVFITSNKWMRAKYGNKLREFFKNEVFLEEIMNFSDIKIFENAITNTNITIFNKINSKNEEVFYSELSKEDNLNHINKFFYEQSIKYKKNKLDLENFSFLNKEEEKLKDKIESKGKPLGKLDYEIFMGIKTGFNEGFIIDETKKKELLKKTPKCKIFLKPILRGRDINKFEYNFNYLWMITIPSGWTNENCNEADKEKFMKNNFPAIFDHFEDIENKNTKINNPKKKVKGLKDRGDKGDYWWELRDCDYYDYFKKEKIIWIELSNENKFSICSKEYYLLAGAFMLTGNNLNILVAYLNSKVCSFLFNIICNSSGMSTSQWKKFALEKLSIPQNLGADKIKDLSNIIKKIHNSDKKIDKNIFITKINKIFYDFFELNKKEINIIENR